MCDASLCFAFFALSSEIDPIRFSKLAQVDFFTNN
jgi:hypothetical protein